MATIKTPGLHADGNGLYLLVDKNGAKRWSFIFRFKNPNGGVSTRREMGLGSLSKVSLADARERAAECRRQVANGINPIQARRVEAASEKTVGVTFGSFGDELLHDITPGFRNPKHAAQWKMTLRVYAAPLRAKPVADVGTDDVLRVLKPIWRTKNETASRLRGRIDGERPPTRPSLAVPTTYAWTTVNPLLPRHVQRIWHVCPALVDGRLDHCLVCAAPPAGTGRLSALGADREDALVATGQPGLWRDDATAITMTPTGLGIYQASCCHGFYLCWTAVSRFGD